MYNYYLLIVCALMSMRAHADLIEASCYWTAEKFESQATLDVSGNTTFQYRIIQSSPLDCGSIDNFTGKIKLQSVNLYCPGGYETAGLIRGGVVGASNREYFYRAEGYCQQIQSNFNQPMIVK